METLPRLSVKRALRSILPPIAWDTLRLMRDRFFGSPPLIRVTVGGYPLLMPSSHNLPYILAHFPQYEGEIARLAEFLSTKRGRAAVVDVGANVGDTVAAIRPRSCDMFFCVEGSANYFRLLQANFKDHPNVICVNALASDREDSGADKRLVEDKGTAHVAGDRSTKDATQVPCLTLDDILAAHPEFPAANLLKIDTDGYDFKVLQGARRLLQDQRPAIHFELSFRHWKHVAGTVWSQAGSFLLEAGYRECLLYDNFGYLMGLDEFRCPRLLPELEFYALRRPDFYVNVITSHQSDPNWEEFKARELGRAVLADSEV